MNPRIRDYPGLDENEVEEVAGMQYQGDVSDCMKCMMVGAVSGGFSVVVMIAVIGWLLRVVQA